MRKHKDGDAGFTIVELLIVIIVIGILATLVLIAYQNVQTQARQAKIQNDISEINKMIEIYHTENGYYPVTGTTPLTGGSTPNTTYTDTNCKSGSNQRTDWVPGLSQPLPQSDGNVGGGVGGQGGCYMYTSDGTYYILSAWNMLKSPQDTTMYRRLGFREMVFTPFYYCNQVNIGGNYPTPYTITKDYYKYSYTYSNIDFCDETPPAGA